MILPALLAFVVVYFCILAVCDLYQQRRMTRPYASRLHVGQLPLAD